jgi:CheY-like chemotaxis protein
MSFDSEGEAALIALQQAVAQVAGALRNRPRVRDALVALSDPPRRALAARVLSAFGFRLYLAGSNAEAAATAACRGFELIVLEAEAGTPLWTSRIRALPAPMGAAAIIALGADQGSDWRADAADSGIDGFALAPVTPGRLAELVVMLAGAPAEDQARREA